MIKIQNASLQIQCIPNFPMFQPGEIREVTEEEAKTLLDNPFMMEASVAEESSTKKKSK